jgi:hypothetical protein
VSEGYLEAMGIDVVEGRTFTRLDDDASSPVIIVNQRLADRFWPEESALGRIVETAGARREVVGVETGKYRSLGEDPALRLGALRPHLLHGRAAAPRGRRRAPGPSPRAPRGGGRPMRSLKSD